MIKHFSWLSAAASLAISAGLLASPGVAKAQQAAGAGSSQGEQQVAADQATPADDIVVTGSRITRSGFTAPTPTTVVGEGDLVRTGATNVASLLNQLPAFRATTSPATGTLTSGSGSNYVDLRGLGITRTLTLVDGQRFVPNNITGQVDLNLIPSLLIDRVDIVTGGASAAYGSDAVAGVVNLIFKKRLDGIEGVAQYGISSRGDNRELNLGLLAGTSFAGGKGHVMIGGEYVDNRGVGAMTTREWGRNAVQLITNPLYAPGNGQPSRIIASNVHPSAATNGGLINSPGILKGIQFGTGGTVSTFNYGNPVGATWMIGGDGGSLADYQQLLTPTKRSSAYGRVSYELSPSVEIAASFLWGRARSVGTGGVTFEPSITVQSDNAYIPGAIKTILTVNGITQFTLGRIGKDYAEDRAQSYFLNINTNNVYRGTLELSGRLGGSWKWNAYYEHGESIYEQETRNQRIEANWARAIDAVDPGNGTIVCRSTLTNPGDGCVPFNIFGQYSATAAARAYITGTVQSRLHFIEDVGAVSISGEPFSTWAGPVSVAFGGEYRSDRASSTVDAISAANGFYSGNPKAIRGTYTVKEAFVETVVPLLADVPLARTLELNAALRYADYSVSGGVASWKVGLNYKPTDSLRIRFTRSRDIRAPNLNELYTQGTNTVAQIIDPTNSSQGNAIISQRGSTALTPERADTLTLGVIYEPQWAPGLRFSVDGYDISVSNVITTLGAQDTVNRCASGATNLCQFVLRNGQNAITSVLTPFLNLASLKTRGIDFEIAYRLPLGGNSGALTFRGLATYVDRLTTDDGLIKIDVAGETGGFRVGGVPHWSATGVLTYERGPLTVSTQLRYVGPGVYDATATPATLDNNKIPSRLYTQLSGSYDLLSGSQGRKLELFGVINNLFDVDPPAAPNATQSFTNAALFDVIGRTFKAGIRFKY